MKMQVVIPGFEGFAVLQGPEDGVADGFLSGEFRLVVNGVNSNPAEAGKAIGGEHPDFYRVRVEQVEGDWQLAETYWWSFPFAAPLELAALPRRVICREFSLRRESGHDVLLDLSEVSVIHHLESEPVWNRLVYLSADGARAVDLRRLPSESTQPHPFGGWFLNPQGEGEYSMHYGISDDIAETVGGVTRHFRAESTRFDIQFSIPA